VIQVVSWFCAEHCGSIVAAGRREERRSPALSAAEEIIALICRPVKYYSRMTTEARSCLCAASLAMRAADWREMEVGLLAANEEGWSAANHEYFRDYLANGRSLGRGNLFIYTLPTSALGEVAIALKLTGPTLHISEDTRPIAGMIRQAEQMLADGEAQGMLVLWSDTQAAVCLAICGGEEAGEWAKLPEAAPLELANHLRGKVAAAGQVQPQA
jgi:hypothetical protein